MKQDHVALRKNQEIIAVPHNMYQKKTPKRNTTLRNRDTSRCCTRCQVWGINSHWPRTSGPPETSFMSRTYARPSPRHALNIHQPTNRLDRALISRHLSPTPVGHHERPTAAPLWPLRVIRCHAHSPWFSQLIVRVDSLKRNLPKHRRLA